MGSAPDIMSFRLLINPLSPIVSRCFFSILRLSRTLASYKSPLSRLILTSFSTFRSSLFYSSPSSSLYSSAFPTEKNLEIFTNGSSQLRWRWNLQTASCTSVFSLFINLSLLLDYVLMAGLDRGYIDEHGELVLFSSGVHMGVLDSFWVPNADRGYIDQYEVLEKCKVQIDVLKELYKHLAEILHECPGQYYR
ncbi:hypothetical protein ACLOJK_025967 [Asimina triloba]